MTTCATILAVALLWMGWWVACAIDEGRKR